MEVTSLNIPPRYFSSVCRVCLTESKLLIPIHEINFTHNFDSSGTIKHIPLTTVFRKYCNVLVCMGDKKPHKICETCMDKLCQAYNVFELFLESNVLLDSILYKNQLQQRELETSSVKSKKNILDDLSADVKLIIAKDSEDNTSCPVAYVELLEQKCDENLIVLPEEYKSATRKKPLRLTFGTHFLNIDNDKPVDEHKFLLPESGGASSENIVDPTCKVEPIYYKPRLRTPPFYVEPKGSLRDHSYSITAKTFLRLSQERRKRKKHLRPKITKNPKIEKVPKLSEHKAGKLQNQEEPENNIFKCRFCELEFEGMEKVFEHLNDEHMATKRCILCPKVFERYDFVIGHVAGHSKHGSVCRRCHKYFKDEESLELHKASEEHKELFPCKICNKEYVSHNRLVIHMKGMHDADSKRKYQCNQCGLMMRWRHNLYTHMQTHQAIEVRRKYLCQFCARSFVNNSSLLFHVRKVHEGQTNLKRNNSGTTSSKTTSSEKQFQCDICDKTFQSESYYKHRLFHPEVSVNCRYCDKVLESPDKYREHRILEHSSFVCEVCQKGFPTDRIMKAHISAHHPRKTYNCTQCDATFKKYQTFHYHKLGHSGQRPYKCEHCGKCFKQSAHKMQHIDSIHSQKRFKCETCGKAFIFDSGLQNHMRSHTGEKPYTCPYCLKAFRDTIARHKHVKHDHPDKMEEFLIYKKQHQQEENKQAKAWCQTNNDPVDTKHKEVDKAPLIKKPTRSKN